MTGRATWRAVLVAGALVMMTTMVACGGSSGSRVSSSPGPASSSTSEPPATTTSTTSPATTTQPASVLDTGVPAVGPARVNVAVATVWSSPSAPRRLDAPALAAPVDMRAWLAAMTVDDRRGLDGRTETQALLGDAVDVTEIRGDWAHVVVPDQPSAKDGRGYPGWVPLRQLSFAPPFAGADDATVVVPLSRLSTGVEVSFGTRLPVAPAPAAATNDTAPGAAASGNDPSQVTVVLPDGRRAALAAADVSITPPGQPARAATADALVAAAKSFTGTPYLWAGMSGFAFDCSGFTHLLYRVHGIRIPRDADDQAAAGTAVTRQAAGPGDLFFYARHGVVHHVAMVVDAHTIVQAPAAGEVVQVVPADTPGRLAELSAARHYR